MQSRRSENEATTRKCKAEEKRGRANEKRLRGISKQTLKENNSNKGMQTIRIERRANKKRPKGNAKQKVIADSNVKEMQSGRHGGGGEPHKQTNKH